jgi:alkylhydroperoxidase family enzyme
LEIGRQIPAREYGLEIVREQQTLRAAARLVVHHDAALEALVDELLVAGDRTQVDW